MKILVQTQEFQKSLKSLSKTILPINRVVAESDQIHNIMISNNEEFMACVSVDEVKIINMVSN